MACREALDRLRSRARPAARTVSLDGAHVGNGRATAEPAARGSPPDLEVAENEAHAALLLAVDRLPPRDRLLVRLVHVDGRPYAEVARLLAVPENSIGPWLLRARERLATSLDARPEAKAPRSAYGSARGTPLTDEVGS